MAVSKIPGAGISGGSVTVNQSAPDNSLVINSSGNVGIGTSSPSYKLHVTGYGFFPGAGNGVILGEDNCLIAGTSATLNSSNMDFYTANTARMRIGSDGKFYLNTTSGTNAVSALRNASTASNKFWQSGPDGNNNYIIYNQAGSGVYLLDGNTSWQGLSDETVKENLVPIENATEKVNSLRAVIGNYIADENKTKHPFLIAQDVEKVLPEAVGQSPEGHLGLSYTDVIPLLVASIKELKAELDATKAEVVALKGAA